MKRYAVPVHEAAALLLGRRAMGYRERITKELNVLAARIRSNLTQKVSPDRPKEGKWMTRGVRALLERLERKMPVHNGLAPWQKTRFHSVWRDFKLLALALR
jgi:hypothetical protein